MLAGVASFSFVTNVANLSASLVAPFALEKYNVMHCYIYFMRP